MVADRALHGAKSTRKNYSKTEGGATEVEVNARAWLRRGKPLWKSQHLCSKRKSCTPESKLTALANKRFLHLDGIAAGWLSVAKHRGMTGISWSAAD